MTDISLILAAKPSRLTWQALGKGALVVYCCGLLALAMAYGP
jgi:hypothetical protein